MYLFSIKLLLLNFLKNRFIERDTLFMNYPTADMYYSLFNMSKMGGFR